jgi:hypothetical protein
LSLLPMKWICVNIFFYIQDAHVSQFHELWIFHSLTGFVSTIHFPKNSGSESCFKGTGSVGPDELGVESWLNR